MPYRLSTFFRGGTLLLPTSVLVLTTIWYRLKVAIGRWNLSRDIVKQGTNYISQLLSTWSGELGGIFLHSFLIIVKAV